MSNAEGLKPSMVCWPATANEHRLILELALSLGFDGSKSKDFECTPGVWQPWEGCVCACVKNGCSNQITIPVPDFIARMYATKECIPDLQEQLRQWMWGNPTKPINFETIGREFREKLHSLEVKSLLFDDVLKRLTKLERCMNEKTSIIDHAFEVDKMLLKRIEGLEKALNDNMVKERKRYVDLEALLKDGVYKTKGYEPKKGDTVVFPDGSAGIVKSAWRWPGGNGEITVSRKDPK
jgi:hypothetical protein